VETFSIVTLTELVKSFGVPGMVFVIWYFSERSHERTLAKYREDMIEQRRMYENNVQLVKNYEGLAKDLKDIVLMNVSGLTRVEDDIKGNQYCPMVRLQKDATGVVR
jgi:hypothetical protein